DAHHGGGPGRLGERRTPLGGRRAAEAHHERVRPEPAREVQRGAEGGPGQREDAEVDGTEGAGDGEPDGEVREAGYGLVGEAPRHPGGDRPPGDGDHRVTDGFGTGQRTGVRAHRRVSPHSIATGYPPVALRRPVKRVDCDNPRPLARRRPVVRYSSSWDRCATVHTGWCRSG